MEREIHSIIDDIHCGYEDDNDGCDLTPQLPMRYQDSEGDDVDHAAQHRHRDTDVSRHPQCLSVYHFSTECPLCVALASHDYRAPSTYNCYFSE